LKVTGRRRIGLADRMESLRPRFSQKSVISILQMSPFMSAIKVIWPPAACQMEIMEECYHRWAGTTLAKEVKLLLSFDTIIFDKR